MLNWPFPPKERYYRYSRYLRERFGTPVSRICVDGGFTCPTRDGTLGYGGCLYCDNASFAPVRTEGLPTVEQQIRDFFEHTPVDDRRYLVYFQPYTNTYAPVEKLREAFRAGLSFPQVVGIIIGTRPDCLNPEVLDLLSEINQSTYVSVEVGIESVYDKNLAWAQRGHTFAQTQLAVNQLAERGIHVAGHLILGFPQESRDEMVASTVYLNALPLQAIKIHHLHIVRGSRLAAQFFKQPFGLFTEEEWIGLVAEFLERLRPDIVIQRLMGEAQADTLIAPRWFWSKGQILNGIINELRSRDSYQGKFYHWGG